MKTKTLSFALSLGLGLFLALLWLLSDHLPPARAADLTVCASGCNYTTIQAAVDAAATGDVIKVAEGDYTDLHLRSGITQTVYVSKTITIRGGYTSAFTEPPDPLAHPTTLDAGGLGRGLVISGPVTVTVEGLRITGGDATGLGGGLWDLDAGGGVYVVTATVTISNNRIFSNTAQFGGGLYLDHSTATLSGNTVTSNTVGTTLSSYGGGLVLHQGTVTLTENAVTCNTACYGGGLFLKSSKTTLNNNTIALNNGLYGGGAYLGYSTAEINSNAFVANTAQHYGGGLYVDHSPASLNANTIVSNIAVDNNSDGGGLYLTNSDNATLDNNSVISNTAGRNGGGLYLNNSDNAMLDSNSVISNTAGQRGGGLRLYYSDATLTNTIIADNQANVAGSAMYIIGSSPRLLHTTIARNSGGDGSGVYITNQFGNYSTVAFTNTILVSHTVGIYVYTGNTATLESTLWGTDTWGNGTDWSGGGQVFTGTVNIWSDPAFVGGGDYHLTTGSAARDAGVDAGVTRDIDGDPRPAGGGPDVGADEISLSLLKTAPATATASEPITYTLTLTNNNSFSVTNVIVSDTVPAGATYVGGGSYAGGGVSWTIANIAPSGGVAQVSFVVTATATITNSQYRVVTSTEGVSTGFGPPVVTVVTLPPCRALAGVNITGPLTGTGTLDVFTAVITPSDAILPVTYTWQATGQTSVTHVVHAITDTVQFTWGVTGTQTVTVTAVDECGVVVSDTHVITIELGKQYIYLPLVLRQFSHVGQALGSEEITGANEWQAPPGWKAPNEDGLMPLPPQKPKLD